MSKLGQKKGKVGFESNVPRCAICVHFREQKICLGTNSQTFRKHAHCSKFGFTVTPLSICDHWQDSAGTTLQKQAA